jgi:hypothetical protein
MSLFTYTDANWNGLKLVTESPRGADLKERILPILASGDSLGGFALTEPGSGSTFRIVLAATDGEVAFVRAVLTVQAFLGALTAVMAFLLARQVMPRAWSAGVGVLTGMSPHLIAMDGYVLTESLFTPVLLAVVLCFLTSWRRGSVAWSLLSGALLGVAILIRPLVMYLWPFMVAAYLLDSNRWSWDGSKRWRRQVPAFVLGVCLTFGPYLVRNAIQFGDLSPGRSRGWESFLHGTYVDMIYRDPRWRGYMWKEDPHFKRMLNDREYAWEELSRRVAADPFGYLGWYLGGKVACSWEWAVYTGDRDVYVYPMKRHAFHEDPLLFAIHRTMRAGHAPIVALAFLCPLALLVAHRRGVSVDRLVLIAPILGIVVYHALLLTIAKPIPRYTIPLRPYAYLLSIGTVWLAISSFQKRGPTKEDG